MNSNNFQQISCAMQLIRRSMPLPSPLLLNCGHASLQRRVHQRRTGRKSHLNPVDSCFVSLSCYTLFYSSETPVQKSDHFDALCCAVLLSSLVCTKLGSKRYRNLLSIDIDYFLPLRTYLPARKDGKRGLDVIRDRRLLLTTAVTVLEKIDCKVHLGFR